MVDNAQFEILLHHQLSKHNSYYDDLATTGAITHPELIHVPENFFSALHENRSNIPPAQQKAKHLVSDKISIEKMAQAFLTCNQVNQVKQ
jgi:hypothetical protein